MISFGFGHSNTAVGLGSTVIGAFGVAVNGVRGVAAGLLVVLLVIAVAGPFRFIAPGVEPLAVTVLVAGANFAGAAGFGLATVAADLAVVVVLDVAAVFAATTDAAGEAFAVSVAFEATTGFDADFSTGAVFPLAADFTVTVATTFDLPFPLVFAVALFTGARRETVLEPAREALAEVTFGIGKHSTETAHKTRIAAR